MKKKFVAIGLFPDRLDLLVVQGGRVTSSRRLPVTLESTAEGWAMSLRKAGPMLGDAVRDMKLAGWSAAVLYANPTATSEYVGVNVSRLADAGDAAVLTIGESLGYPMALAVTSAAVVAADSRKSDAHGNLTHVVVAADRDDHAAALADLVQDAGLKLWSATPIDAAIMMKVATDALLNKVERGAHLYVGEQRSFFLVIENGSLAFARPIGLGMQTLATSLTRPMRSHLGGEVIELDPHTARVVLQRYGFPNRSTVIDLRATGNTVPATATGDTVTSGASLGLTGAQIIPLLQPVLQRFVVELRQSLRFGLGRKDEAGATSPEITINFCGPGSSIPGFAGIVAAELRMAVEIDPSYAAENGQSPSAPAESRTDAPGRELLDAISDMGVLSRLNLQPRELAHARQIYRLQRWVWTGAALALALVGFEAMSTQAKLRSVQMQAEAEATRSSESQTLHASSQKMLSAIEAMISLENTVAFHVGAQVNFRACMQEIASLVPTNIRLTEIRFNQNDNKTTGSVLGYAFPDGQVVSGRKTDLETFISRLTESPLFDKVALGNVQVASVSSRSAQQFEVAVTGVAVPVIAGAGSPESHQLPESASVQAQEGSPQ